MKNKAENGELFFYSREAKDRGILNSLPMELYEKATQELSSILGDKPIIITEGKTDWKHLKQALRRFQDEYYYLDLDIEFLQYEDNIQMGDAQLDSMVESFKKTNQPRKTIFMFDRDNDKYTRKYGNEEFYNYKNNVYIFCIPKINDELDNICLEFYYEENNLKTEDESGRRLFLGKDFFTNGNSKCGEYQAKEQNKCSKLSIIDDRVFKKDDLEHTSSVVLSKNDFSKNILEEKENFNNFNIENFKKIFDLIEKIIK